jgi:hypothetical protein
LKKRELMKHHCPIPNLSWWRAHQRSWFLHLPGECSGQTGWHRPWHQVKNRKSKSSVHRAQDHLGLKNISRSTKLQIFNSNVKPMFLYGAKTWRTTKTALQKIQTFYNNCLRRTLYIRWPERITNEELWRKAKEESIPMQIRRRKWGWTGHTLKKPPSNTTRQVQTWNPHGKRGRQRNTSRQDTDSELKDHDTIWQEAAKAAGGLSLMAYVPHGTTCLSK